MESDEITASMREDINRAAHQFMDDLRHNERPRERDCVASDVVHVAPAPPTPGTDNVEHDRNGVTPMPSSGAQESTDHTAQNIIHTKPSAKELLAKRRRSVWGPIINFAIPQRRPRDVDDLTAHYSKVHGPKHRRPPD